mgnify:CR=1 FL=1
MINFEGIKTTHTFNDPSLDMFDMYYNTANGYQVSGGILNFDNRSEYKAIYNKQKDLSEFEVSLKLNAYFIPQINAGVYLMASNANNEQDKISALNVQIEKAVESNSYVISLFEFDSFNKVDNLLKEVILKIAERWNSDEQLVISTSEAEELKAFFAAKAKELLDKGVEVKQINGVKGFSISPADGSYKVNFGEGEFETFLKSFLRPQIVELLF